MALGTGMYEMINRSTGSYAMIDNSIESYKMAAQEVIP